MQAEVTRNALLGWIYVAPLEPQTPAVRMFKKDVKNATERYFGIQLGEDVEVDSAAAHLYDAIYLWAKGASKVLSKKGA
jgi:hypothetical protein